MLKIDERDEAFRHWFGLQSKMPYRNPEEIAGMGFYAGIAWGLGYAQRQPRPCTCGAKPTPYFTTEHMRQAVLLERERCAKLCEALGGAIDERDPDESRLTANSLAAAIRAGTEQS